MVGPKVKYRILGENLKVLGVKDIILEVDAAQFAKKKGEAKNQEEGGPAATTRENTLKKEAAVVDECRSCQLGYGRTHSVYGDGSAYAEIMFVGEAPGAEEDKQGLPFVGRAGKLLDRLLEQVGLNRSEIYICNVIKCRPPGNREPTAEEIDACRPYLNKQITLIKPNVIVCLGLYAAQAILNSKESMSRLRAGRHTVGEITVIPTYHTAAALRFPSYKQQIFEDLRRARDVALGR